MLHIKLIQTGQKKQTFYKICVSKGKATRNGSNINCIGFFFRKERKLRLNLKSLKKYLYSGAIATNSARHVLLQALNTLIK